MDSPSDLQAAVDAAFIDLVPVRNADNAIMNLVDHVNGSFQDAEMAMNDFLRQGHTLNEYQLRRIVTALQLVETSGDSLINFYRLYPVKTRINQFNGVKHISFIRQYIGPLAFFGLLTVKEPNFEVTISLSPKDAAINKAITKLARKVNGTYANATAALNDFLDQSHVLDANQLGRIVKILKQTPDTDCHKFGLIPLVAANQFYGASDAVRAFIAKYAGMLVHLDLVELERIQTW